ncbi:MAG: DUF2442 domain-containing protein, partial [Candidatus Binatia bacterium]|nr:DUF2442 domain-containing protein [Candidatus Binatia bacterium]
EDAIVARLKDGRVISVPLIWSWRLSDASSLERTNFQFIGDGEGVHWPDIDEDISVEGMLHGVPAHRPQTSVRLSRSRANGHGNPPSKRLARPKRTRRSTAKR